MTNSKPSAKSPIFQVSLLLCGAAASLTLLWPDTVTRVTKRVTGAIFETMGGAFLISVSVFLVLCIWLALSRHGKKRLGAPDSRPEFSTLSWLSMLFAAGMGTGLVVWGVSEPMFHMLNPPSGPAGNAAAAEQAFLITNFHWGIHAWAIYGVGALTLAYFSFVRGGAYLPSTPIRLGFKGSWTGPIGTGADLLAILAVTFGVAGSIAMGTLLVHSGLHYVAGVEMESTAAEVGILLTLFVAYMTSAATGLEKGIRILSNINMATAVILILVLLGLGSTGSLLSSFVSIVADYGAALVPLSVDLQPFDGSPKWISDWTLIYFVWWIAWTPFVGTFIARISRGRTIREFIVGVLVCPTIFSIFWFAVMGGVATEIQMGGTHDFTAAMDADLTGLVFQVVDQLPGGLILGVIVTMLAFIFLVTSVDSATFVLGMLSSDGDLNPTPRRKLAWGIALGILGAGFTFLGDIDVIKMMTIAGAIPFLLVLLLQLGAFIKALIEEPR